MSLSMGEIEMMTVQHLQRALASEKLTHMSSILKYRYGIDVSPDISNSDDSYALVLRDVSVAADMRVSYSSEGIIKTWTELEAQFIMTTFIGAFPTHNWYSMMANEYGNANISINMFRGTGENSSSPHRAWISDAKELRNRLAREKIDHICSILACKYGLELTIRRVGDNREISLTNIEEPYQARYCYSADRLLECNVEQETSMLQRYFIRRYGS